MLFRLQHGRIGSGSVGKELNIVRLGYIGGLDHFPIEVAPVNGLKLIVVNTPSSCNGSINAPYCCALKLKHISPWTSNISRKQQIMVTWEFLFSYAFL